MHADTIFSAFRGGQRRLFSLKNLLQPRPESELKATYSRLLELLLQGIRLHAVEVDQADWQKFRADLKSFELAIGPNQAPADLLVAVGAVNQAMGEYSRRLTQQFHQQKAALAQMISMFTDTVIAMDSSGARCVDKLQCIEAELRKASVTEEMNELKAKLGACLEAVQEEALRQRAETRTLLSKMRQQLIEQGVKPVTGEEDECDRVTGLPGRTRAIKEIETFMGAAMHPYVLVAVLDQLGIINARHGYAVGDQMLIDFKHHLERHLPPNCCLFRWRGPALVALFKTDAPPALVTRDMGKAVDHRIERTFDTGTRSTQVFVKPVWSVVPILPPLQKLVQNIDSFVAIQSQQQQH